MRIMLLTSTYPPEIGGAANLCLELAQALSKLGHDIKIVTRFPLHLPKEIAPEYKGNILLREQRPEAEVLRINIPQLSRKIPLLREIEHVLYIIAFIFAGLVGGAMDVIWTSSPPLEMGLAAIVIKRLKRIKFVFNIQDIFPQNLIDLGVMTNRYLIAICKTLESYIYRHSDWITVMSQGNKEIVDRSTKMPQKVSVIQNWIDTDYVLPGERINGFCREFGLRDKFVLSFAGCIADSQDMDIILSSAKRLEDHEDIIFLLAANGPREEDTRRRIIVDKLKNVLMIPIQPREKYVELLAASDVGLVTLNPRVATPTVPSKIKSIMAAARPVLASLPLSGDAPKLIDQAKCGIVVPAGNNEEFYQAILKLYRDPIKRAEYGKNGRQYVVANLSSSYGAREYEKIFLKMVDKSPLQVKK